VRDDSRTNVVVIGSVFWVVLAVVRARVVVGVGVVTGTAPMRVVEVAVPVIVDLDKRFSGISIVSRVV
jgi:hypothetical protein